jgi:hypothetical protein
VTTGAFCLLLVSVASAGAAELQIQFSAIQKVLAQEVFTTEGRRYVSGNPSARCSFAYLEHPELSGADGRLNLKARFTGRSALDLFGRCIGLGDSFDVWITATPYYRKNAIALKDVKVESPGRSGYYVRRVCASLGDSLRKQFEYRIVDDAKRLLEQRSEKSPYRQELVDFDVPAIRVTPEALLVTLEFTVAVK